MIDSCLQTKDALLQHVRRATLQSYIWSCCVISEDPVINIAQSEWKIDQHGTAQPF